MIFVTTKQNTYICKMTLAQQLKGYDFQNTIISKGIQISVGWFFKDCHVFGTFQIELFVQY